MAEPMIEDERVNHTPFTPLGEDNDHPEIEQFAALMKQIPEIKLIMKRFQKQIDHLNSLSAVPMSATKDVDLFRHTVAANKMFVSYLTKEQNYLQKKIESLLLKQ